MKILNWSMLGKVWDVNCANPTLDKIVLNLLHVDPVFPGLENFMVGTLIGCVQGQ